MTKKSVIDEINDKFGNGAIMSFTPNSIVNIGSISTGSLALDHATGIGGVPRGRITEIMGMEGTGKSTTCLQLIAEAQKSSEKITAYIDPEHAFDPSYAQRCGVDIERVYISQPDNGEQALEICEALVRSEECSLVIIDSVAALVPKAEIDGEMEDMQVGLQARLMSKAMRKMTGAISKTDTAVVFTNQIRQKIGIMFGSPNITSGGMALKFYASMRLELKRIQSIKEGGNIVGSIIRFKIIKNKVAPPFGEAEVEIEHGKGYSTYGEVLDLAVEYGIVSKRASYYFINEERIGQGRANVKEMLKDNEELYNELKTQVKEKLSGNVDVISEENRPIIEPLDQEGEIE